jgi:flavin reductase (DIM6/NTAB) family NADH-FMN oxidoreductase RutF
MLDEGVQMNRHVLTADKFICRPVQLWNEWLLLTAGDHKAGKFNAMTVAWGSTGVMWGRPFVQVVVRPTRHTLGFMNQYPTFKVCGFPAQFKEALALLGSRSGRDSDKIAASGLTPVAATTVEAPTFKEADLSIECRTIYAQQFSPDSCKAEYIAGNYNGDYHWQFYGEIMAITATDRYMPE